MTILHVVLDLSMGGTENVVRNLILGHEGHIHAKQAVACLNADIGPIGRELKAQGIEIEPLGRRSGIDLRLVLALRAYLIKRRPDVIHCHQYTPFFYAGIAAMGLRCKIVFTEHGRFHPDQRKLSRVLFNQWLQHQAQAVIAISRATKDALVRYEGFKAARIKVIYNGAPEAQGDRSNQLRQELALPKNAVVVGSIARLDRIKNHEMMIEAFSLVHTDLPDVYLVLIGDGPNRDAIRNLIAEKRLERRVLMAGYRESAADYLGLFTLFLLSSWSEGTSVTLLEAMARRIPIVATDVGGNPEVVNPEVGLLSPSNDAPSFAQNIKTLLMDESRLRLMGENARAQYQARFSCDAMAAAYWQIYNDTMLA